MQQSEKFTLHDEISEETAEELADLPELTRRLLANRGITTLEEAKKFLEPDYDRHTHDPYEMKDMEEAVERIIEAVEKDERVVIFSDYDTDGIPGAVILHDFFVQVGHENFKNYIPHRNKEGFGMNMKAIEQFIDNETDLLITVDCGITAVKEIEKAVDAGIDVIITDHHLPSTQSEEERNSADENDGLPPALAILDPKQEACDYPEENLCGAGVVFKLVTALVNKLQERDYEFAHSTPEGWEKWLLDMVGIATVSDMVPLVGENRVLAWYGLDVLRKSRRPGLLALLDKARVQQKNITEGDVGFMIGPRINAASRMDEPEDAFRLLATQDSEEGEKLADHLNKINDKRKGIVSSMVKEIKKKLAKRDNIGPVVVTGNPEYKPALLGLACNSLVDAYDRPVFLWGRSGDGQLSGSCRAGDGVNLVDIMSAVPDEVFKQFGGHAQSGGFVVYDEYVHTLEEILTEAYEEAKTGEESVAMTMVDTDLDISDVGWSVYDEIKQLAPFGEGNPKPLFKFEDAEIASVSHFGKANNHLKIMFKNGGRQVEAIEFFATEDNYDVELEAGEKVTLLAHIEKSTFGGRASVRLRIVDIHNE